MTTGDRHDDRDLEAALSRALHADADRIVPTDRLPAIRAATVTEIPSRRRGPRLVTLIGAAAAAALALSFAANQWLPRTSPGVPGGSGTASVSAPVTPSTGGSPSAVAGSALPVYYLAPAPGAPSGFALYRTYASVVAAAHASPSERVRMAVTLALRQPIWRTSDLPSPWAGTSVTDVSVTSGLITVTLSDPAKVSAPGAGALPTTVERLAIQQLVWTAQAAAGLDRLPVTFRIADGATLFFNRYPAADRYDRPNTDAVADEIARVWIDTPGLDATMAAGAPIPVRGLGFAKAADLTWTVVKSGDTIASGTPTASGVDALGGRQFGYAVTIPALPAGSYQLWVTETRAGTEAPPGAEVPLTVR